MYDKYVRHPSLNGNGGAFNPAFAGLRDRLNGSTAPVKPPVQSEPSLDLPPRPAKPRRQRSSAHARRLEGLAAFCGRSTQWARNIEKELEAAGIFGPALIRLALEARTYQRIEEHRSRDRELVQAFNRAPRHVREQLVALID